jgi:hypothetical protein
MAKFDADTLRELRDFQEVAIRTERHPDSAAVIWVVVADDEVFVRSVRGSKGRWYRDLATGGSATLEFAGRQVEVRAFPGERRRSYRASQPRIFEEVPAEPLRAGDGTRRGPADHIATRTALTSRTSGPSD